MKTSKRKPKKDMIDYDLNVNDLNEFIDSESHAIHFGWISKSTFGWVTQDKDLNDHITINLIPLLLHTFIHEYIHIIHPLIQPLEARLTEEDEAKIDEQAWRFFNRMTKKQIRMIGKKLIHMLMVELTKKGGPKIHPPQ